MNKVTQAPILTTHIKFLSYAFLSLLACFADVAKTGVDEWTSLGLETAQANAIAVAPSNPAIVYVGTNGGTVFKSTDSGATWQALQAPNVVGFSISSLAIDPINPNIIYAASQSSGVFKSSDGGANWQHMLVNLHFTDVEIDSRNPSTVYVSSFDGGVFKTTDGAASWQGINNGLTSGAINVLAIASSDSMTLYAGSIGGFVFKTTDAGATWQDVSGFGNSGSILALAVDPNNPAIVYAGTRPGGVLPSGVFKSTDGGASWQAVNNGLTGLDIRDIAINPSKPTIVYAGTLDGGVFKSTDSGATWQAINVGLPDLAILDLAFDPGNPATVYAVAPNAGVFKITFSTDNVPDTVPVVLIHGIGGSPSSFGEMEMLLEEAALRTEPFDYSVLTGAGSVVTIEELAGLFAAHVLQVLEDTGATQVDVVAHSMGGLITRAWMSGMLANLQIPYEGQIRKLILVGTPNYGAALGLLNGICSVAFGNLGCSETQAEQMRFGSAFITTLHDRWRELQQNSQHRIPEGDILFVAGTRGSPDGIECRDITSPDGCDDGVVDISSVALPDSLAERVRYVPYRHGDFPIIRPFGGLTLVGVTDDRHATYRLVLEFLKNGLVLDQCCGENTVDYNPPHLRGLQDFQEGLLLIRLLDSVTGQPITTTPFIVRPIRQDFLQQGNRDGGAVTAWGMRAPRQYSVTVAARRYRSGILRNIQINVARPTVPEPFDLVPR